MDSVTRHIAVARINDLEVELAYERSRRIDAARQAHRMEAERNVWRKRPTQNAARTAKLEVDLAKAHNLIKEMRDWMEGSSMGREKERADLDAARHLLRLAEAEVDNLEVMAKRWEAVLAQARWSRDASRRHEQRMRNARDEARLWACKMLTERNRALRSAGPEMVECDFCGIEILAGNVIRMGSHHHALCSSCSATYKTQETKEDESPF